MSDRYFLFDSPEESPPDEEEEAVFQLHADVGSVGAQISESEKSRNHIEFGKLGAHMDVLFGAMSQLSK